MYAFKTLLSQLSHPHTPSLTVTTGHQNSQFKTK